MVTNFLFVLFALIIDGFQMLIAIAFTAIGATSASIGLGAAAGAVCSVAGSAKLTAACAGIVAAVASPLNAATAVTVGPVAALIGLVIGALVSLTLGTALVVALAMKGMFYPRYVVPAYIGEVTPGFDLIPAWTFLVLRSIFRKKAEKAKGIFGGVTDIRGLVQTTRSGSELAVQKAEQAGERAKQAIQDIIPRGQQPPELEKSVA